MRKFVAILNGPQQLTKDTRPELFETLLSHPNALRLSNDAFYFESEEDRAAIYVTLHLHLSGLDDLILLEVSSAQWKISQPGLDDRMGERFEKDWLKPDTPKPLDERMQDELQRVRQWTASLASAAKEVVPHIELFLTCEKTLPHPFPRRKTLALGELGRLERRITNLSAAVAEIKKLLSE